MGQPVIARSSAVPDLIREAIAIELSANAMMEIAAHAPGPGPGSLRLKPDSAVGVACNVMAGFIQGNRPLSARGNSQ
jgi:hypothetical protein